MKIATNVLSDAALIQRRDELLYRLGETEALLAQVVDVLASREAGGKRLPSEIRHGTPWGYRRGCRCRACSEAHAADVAAYREHKNAQRSPKPPPKKETSTMPEHPKIPRPNVDLRPGPRGLVYAMCRHCDWQAGPSVKTYITERAIAHRKDHRAGLLEVTR